MIRSKNKANYMTKSFMDFAISPEVAPTTSGTLPNNPPLATQATTPMILAALLATNGLVAVPSAANAPPALKPHHSGAALKAQIHVTYSSPFGNKIVTYR